MMRAMPCRARLRMSMAYRRRAGISVMPQAPSPFQLGACGMTEMPARRLYAILMRNLARQGMARIILARHEESDIGFIFGGVVGAVYRGQQFSYNNAWRRWSIGNLLQVEQVRWLCEEGVSRYDMGPLDGEAMRYKEHWTERRLPLETWLLIPRQG